MQQSKIYKFVKLLKFIYFNYISDESFREIKTKING